MWSTQSNKRIQTKFLGTEALGISISEKQAPVTWEAFMAGKMVPKTRCYLTHVNTRKENDSAEIFVL